MAVNRPQRSLAQQLADDADDARRCITDNDREDAKLFYRNTVLPRLREITSKGDREANFQVTMDWTPSKRDQLRNLLEADGFAVSLHSGMLEVKW